MKYAIRIGLAFALASVVTLVAFQLLVGLLKAGAGMSFKAGALSVVSDPHVVYLEPKQGEKYDVLVEKGAVVFFKGWADIQVEFTSPEIRDYLYGQRKHLYGEEETYAVFIFDASFKKRPEVMYVELPGRLTVHGYQRSSDVDSVAVGIYGKGEGPWQLVTETNWYGLIVHMDEKMRRERVWSGTEVLDTVVPIDAEPTGIALQAGDYLLLSGERISSISIRVELHTPDGQVFYWPSYRQMTESDNPQVKGYEQIFHPGTSVMPRGFLVPFDSQLWIACLVGVNYSARELVIGTRSARVGIKVLRKVR